MKRLIMGLGLLMGLIAGALIIRPAPVAADVGVTVTLHSTAAATGRGQPTFTVYDMRSVTSTVTPDLQQQLAADDPNTIAAYIAAHGLPVVATAVPNASGFATFTLMGGAGAPYLIVQNGSDAAAVAEPMLFALPDDGGGLTLETKPVTVARVPYFYKYGRDGAETKPLAGAIFGISQVVDGITKYLTTDGNWVVSDDPLDEANLYTATSAADGLVLLSDLPVGPGAYTVTELLAPEGYEVTDEALAIALVLPASGPITINGHELKDMLANHVLASEAGRTELRVYNDTTDGWPYLPNTYVPPRSAVPPSTTTPGKPGGGGWPNLPNTFGFLPQTGEAKSVLAIIGFIVMGLTIYFWIRTTRAKRNEI